MVLKSGFIYNVFYHKYIELKKGDYITNVGRLKTERDNLILKMILHVSKCVLSEL